jgi:hypothetical protein
VKTAQIGDIQSCCLNKGMGNMNLNGKRQGEGGTLALADSDHTIRLDGMQVP